MSLKFNVVVIAKMAQTWVGVGLKLREIAVFSLMQIKN